MLAFHPKRNRLLKSVWGVLLVFAMAPLGTPVYGSAGPANGNPFSNGTFWPSEGTFQAIMRGKNLTGVATFSTVGTGIANITASGGGIFSVFYNGITYVGNVNSAIDVNSGQIAATFQASFEGEDGEGSTIIDSQFGLISETFDSGGTTTTVEGGQTTSEDSIEERTTVTDTFEGDPPVLVQTVTVTEPVVVTTETTTSDVINSETTPATLTQEFGFIDTIANFQYNDSLYAAGSFIANLQDSYPNQAFFGKGTFAFSSLGLSSEGIPQVITETVNFKVNGVRVSNTVQTFTPFDITIPGVVVSFEIQRGGSSSGGTTAN